MNDIGFGILCFGEPYYFEGALDKIKNFQEYGLDCYLLTDRPSFFKDQKVTIIPHVRTYYSYHDKMVLPKYILEKHDTCILIDADLHIPDFSFLDVLKTYNFKNGITYLSSLINHSAKREYVKDLDLTTSEWVTYHNYCESICPNFNEFETIWEYFLVIKKEGFNRTNFYNEYEKLQLAKEFSDVKLNKEVSGAGEGISIAIASDLSDTQIQKDEILYDLLKDKMTSLSRRYTPKELWPNWMK